MLDDGKGQDKQKFDMQATDKKDQRQTLYLLGRKMSWQEFWYVNILRIHFNSYVIYGIIVYHEKLITKL